jgi:two-component system KDP operon response regulator KdpE
MPASGEAAERRVVSGDLEIDFAARRATLNGNAVRLTPKEFDLLKFLVDHANKPIPHRKLLQTVWGPDYGEEVEYLRVVVNQLRKKIEPVPSKPRYLLTEPWVGYRFALPENE